MADRIIIWTTPHMRAERALAHAGVALEFRRYPQAREQLREALGHLRDLIRQVDLEEACAQELEFRRREFDQKMRGEHVGT